MNSIDKYQERRMDFSVRFLILVSDGLDQKGGKRMSSSLSICSIELQLKKERKEERRREKSWREKKSSGE